MSEIGQDFNLCILNMQLLIQYSAGVIYVDFDIFRNNPVQQSMVAQTCGSK